MKPDPIRQYRPFFPPSVDSSVQSFARQTIDLIQGIRDAYGPLSLFSRGAGEAIKVSTEQLGFGVAVTLSRPGSWLLTASVCLQIVGDANQAFQLDLSVGGTIQTTHSAITKAAANQTLMVHQTWQINGSESDLCRLLMSKAGGGGTSSVDASNSTLTATWQGTA